MLVYAYEQGGATTAGSSRSRSSSPRRCRATRRLARRPPPADPCSPPATSPRRRDGGTAAVLLADGRRCRVRARRGRRHGRDGHAAGAGSAPASLARTPEELTASNVVAGWIESRACSSRPRSRASCSASAGPAVFAVMAVVAAAAAVLVAPVEAAARRRRPVLDEDARRPRGRRARAGRAAVVAARGRGVAIGALDVLYVVLAVGVLGHEGGTAGYLNAAFGLGGVVGDRGDGRARRPPAARAGAAREARLWAGARGDRAHGHARAAFLLLAAAGVGRTTLDVAGRTSAADRDAPALLARVFGLLEG